MEAVILIGIQGSGKSTFYRDRFFDTHVRISLDLLKTRDRQRALLRLCLATGQRFVVDNTNVRKAERAAFIVPARESGFNVTGYYLEVGLRDALRRNAQRTGAGRVPVPGVAGTLKRLERPELSEGFHALYLVSRDEADRFLVQPWADPAGVANV